MFTPKTSHSASGFTLVELLTVIAIIAVLMGILFPTINSAIENAKKVQAKNDELQIVNAVKGYYTEYGKYPDVGSGNIANAADSKALMQILRAKETGTTLQNPRKIVFLEAPDAKNLGTAAKERSGIGSNGQFLDPWGTATGFYYVSIDADYDNEVDNPYSSNAGNTKLSTGVIAWSRGRDAQGGSGDKNGTNGKDDVISWQ